MLNCHIPSSYVDMGLFLGPLSYLIGPIFSISAPLLYPFNDCSFIVSFISDEGSFLPHSPSKLSWLFFALCFFLLNLRAAYQVKEWKMLFSEKKQNKVRRIESSGGSLWY